MQVSCNPAVPKGTSAAVECCVHIQARFPDTLSVSCWNKCHTTGSQWSDSSCFIAEESPNSGIRNVTSKNSSVSLLGAGKGQDNGTFILSVNSIVKAIFVRLWARADDAWGRERILLNQSFFVTSGKSSCLLNADSKWHCLSTFWIPNVSEVLFCLQPNSAVSVVADLDSKSLQLSALMNTSICSFAMTQPEACLTSFMKVVGTEYSGFQSRNLRFCFIFRCWKRSQFEKKRSGSFLMITVKVIREGYSQSLFIPTAHLHSTLFLEQHWNSNTAQYLICREALLLRYADIVVHIADLCCAWSIWNHLILQMVKPKYGTSVTEHIRTYQQTCQLKDLTAPPWFLRCVTTRGSLSISEDN